MSRVWAVGINTFREAVRARILYAMVAAAIVLLGFAIVLNQLSVGQEGAILVDVGIATISLFSVLVSIVLGISLVYSEIEQRTIFTILSKPLARWEFLLGKFVGLNLTVALMTVAMAVGFLALLAALGTTPTGPMVEALAFCYLEAMVITAVALLFSSFSTPYLSGFFAAGIFFVGHLSGDIRAFGDRSDSESLKMMTEGIYRIVPNLEFLNLKNHAMAGVSLGLADLAPRAGYGVLYAAMVLLLAMGIFSRRDFK